jgi:hypothetical protein
MERLFLLIVIGGILATVTIAQEATRTSTAAETLARAGSTANHGLKVKIELSRSEIFSFGAVGPPVPNLSNTAFLVTVNTNSDRSAGKNAKYVYSVSAGRVFGFGPSVAWDVGGVAPGVYSVTVEVTDGHELVASDTRQLEVRHYAAQPSLADEPDDSSAADSDPDITSDDNDEEESSAGNRARTDEPCVLVNHPPTATVKLSSKFLYVSPITEPGEQERDRAAERILVNIAASDPDNDSLLYTYSVTGGHIVGDGPQARWDLMGLEEGQYSLLVEVNDGGGFIAWATETIEVRQGVTNDTSADMGDAEDDNDDSETNELESSDTSSSRCQLPPVASLAVSSAIVFIDQIPDTESAERGSEVNSVFLRTTASVAEGESLTYTFTVTAGQIIGWGPDVRWDLWGVGPGKYSATVEVNDGDGRISWVTQEVEVRKVPTPKGVLWDAAANGFIFVFGAYPRKMDPSSPPPNHPPVVEIRASTNTLVSSTASGLWALTWGNYGTFVTLTSTASDPDGDNVSMTYTTTAGRIIGEGPVVQWDLTGVERGKYTATVEVNDGCGCIAWQTVEVTVMG